MAFQPAFHRVLTALMFAYLPFVTAQTSTDNTYLDAALSEYSVTAGNFGPTYTSDGYSPASTSGSSYDGTTSNPIASRLIAWSVIAGIVGIIVHIIFIYLVLVKLSCGKISGETLRHPRRSKEAYRAARRPDGPIQVPSRYAAAPNTVESAFGDTKTPGSNSQNTYQGQTEAHGVQIANTAPQEVGGLPIARPGVAELGTNPQERDRRVR